MTQLPPDNDANQQSSDQPIVPQPPVVPPLAPTQGNPNVLGGGLPPQAPPTPQAPQQSQFAAPQPPQMPQAPQPMPVPQYAAPQAPYGQYPGQQPSHQYPAQKPPTNVLAIVSFVGSFFVGLVGVIVGHIALSQIKRTGESGRGFALAGTIIGYVSVAASILGVILAITMFGIFGTIASNTLNDSLNELDQFEQDLNASEDDSDIGFSATPWDGTADAPFCDALANFDLSYDDEAQYYKNILAETDDAEFKNLLQEQIDYLAGDVYALSDEDFSKYIDSYTEVGEMQAKHLERCYSL